ncbi:hypothetical protein GCM10007216_28200 [Thalassobacillus devorans]|uniref:Nucleotidyltransferase with HDIG domain n=1 Tax=Thalassobacillus devorans TaxID=279813 RepID=A0ABQ1PF07_9BACI|nr:HD domain-containing phosphohydrolase [Thalassobacillus devorans]NIK29325.1 putative nucleotidyltransferase with HDIG domain [Thalassobacillus devorans]GGC95798.1 hypothetical protein GCM10007216_28200 [Thalassobacillus devorans]
MRSYSLQELANLIDRNPVAVGEWFNELELNINHHVSTAQGERVFDEQDLKIAEYIAEKRDERLPFEEIFKIIDELFVRKPPVEDKKQRAKTEVNVEEPFTGLGRDPETLFYEIAQDNEVIKMFKYHSLRVMYMASMLAKRVNCYDEDLRIAAMLHDIGKMGLSKNILLKPGKLSELEFTLIQSHCHIGNVIVRKHLGLTRAAKFVRDHHEKWDGTGYPRRLLGDEITVQGRIISICDAFDTMTIDQRNYNKKTLGYEEAFQELQRCAWTQFDGNLVNSFVSMMQDISIPEYMIQKE